MVVFSNCEVTANSALMRGGLQAGPGMTVVDSAISSNRLISNNRDGGAVRMTDGVW